MHVEVSELSMRRSESVSAKSAGAVAAGGIFTREKQRRGTKH